MPPVSTATNRRGSNATRLADRIVGAGLISAFAMRKNLLATILEEMANLDPFSGISEAMERLRAILAEADPLFGEHLASTELAAWMGGYNWTAGNFPAWLNREFSIGLEGPPPPTATPSWPWGDGEPVVRFPLLEKAAESLSQRGILTRDDFDAASETIRSRAFTVARQQSTEAIEQIRTALTKDIQDGTSLRSFSARIADLAEASPIGTSHLETVYRTNVQAAFRDGRETLLQNRIVDEVFPYQEYIPIRDGRVRPDHLALEKLGLSGTGVYRRDDPFWDYFTPPWDYNCRCGASPLTIDAAARKGVREAQDWLKTGRPPEQPEWRIGKVPFAHKSGFGQRGRVAA